jgi:serine/threonine-protein kinase
VPDEFWRLFAYYLSASAITSIVWAKYYSPDDLEEIVNRNHEILEWFDNMQSSIPTWFQTVALFVNYVVVIN